LRLEEHENGVEIRVSNEAADSSRDLSGDENYHTGRCERDGEEISSGNDPNTTDREGEKNLSTKNHLF
jgi:hypothetical protein